MKNAKKLLALLLLAALLPLCAVACQSKSKAFKVVDYLTTDWDSKRVVIEGKIYNNSKDIKENVVLHYHVEMKDGKKADLGEIKFPQLKANGDYQEYKLDVHDKAMQIKNFDLRNVKSFAADIQ